MVSRFSAAMPYSLGFAERVPQRFARPDIHRKTVMKSRAAVAFKAGEPLQIVEIDVAPPQKGEVLVKITHTGVCHTDA
ncbi:MAG: hypothetical protein RR800_12655, partial [Comamonas sp.]